jgi:Signal peptidase, peptidase S26
VSDPISRWIESTFGVTTEDGTGALIRATPRPVGGYRGAALKLAGVTGMDATVCAERIKEQLLIGSQIRHPETEFPVFAFRLHQFISRGEPVYTDYCSILFVQTYEIPGMSMEGTLLPGDRILAKTFRPSLQKEAKWCSSPGNRARILVKRVIAVPGDRLRISRKVVMGSDLVHHFPVSVLTRRRSTRRRWPRPAAGRGVRRPD